MIDKITDKLIDIGGGAIIVLTFLFILICFGVFCLIGYNVILLLIKLTEWISNL